jgi:hypothetical protein
MEEKTNKEQCVRLSFLSTFSEDTLFHPFNQEGDDDGDALDGCVMAIFGRGCMKERVFSTGHWGMVSLLLLLLRIGFRSTI